jgi:hypothetical protein
MTVTLFEDAHRLISDLVDALLGRRVEALVSLRHVHHGGGEAVAGIDLVRGWFQR